MFFWPTSPFFFLCHANKWSPLLSCCFFSDMNAAESSENYSKAGKSCSEAGSRRKKKCLRDGTDLESKPTQWLQQAWVQRFLCWQWASHFLSLHTLFFCTSWSLPCSALTHLHGLKIHGQCQDFSLVFSGQEAVTPENCPEIIFIHKCHGLDGTHWLLSTHLYPDLHPGLIPGILCQDKTPQNAPSDLCWEEIKEEIGYTLATDFGEEMDCLE